MSVSPDMIAFAHKLADAAGEVIRPYFRQRLDVSDKRPIIHGRPVFDPVTEADKNAEKAIRAIIERERPHDGILGEEFGEKKGTNRLRWVLDPVDGTRAFINGRHEWGCLIALEEDEPPGEVLARPSTQQLRSRAGHSAGLEKALQTGHARRFAENPAVHAD